MKSPRPRLESLAIVALLLLFGYAAADLTTLALREKLLPGEPPVTAPPRMLTQGYTPKEKFQIITGRNIFSSDQKISDALGGSPTEKQDGEPVPTNLPISLVGTLVHANPSRSVATITLTSKSGEVVAVRVDGEIPDHLGTVTKI